VQSPPKKVSMRSKARHIVGTGLRSSPAPVQDALKRGSKRVLQALDPPLVWQVPEVPLPDGLSLAEVEKVFYSWSVNGEPVGHMDGYVGDSKLRFLHTWGLVRNESGSCLELGGNPYFTTWLLDNYSDLELTLANYYGERGEARETVSWLPKGATARTETDRISSLFNVEEDEFPYADDTFDVLLFCEMLEHMLMNPMATLRQIHRVLKPDGILVLTTPNVARLENVLQLMRGANICDMYSGFGPYGRHNREYTLHELHRLLEFAGFEVETSMTADGHPANATKSELYGATAPLIEARQPDLGQYMFVRARAARPPREGLPSFLYRSWPPDKIVEFE